MMEMSSRALKIICDDLIRYKPTRILEFGSGASTVALARASRKLGGGRVVDSIEHNPYFAARTSECLLEEGLSNFACVHLCSLEQYGDDRRYLHPFDDVWEFVLIDGPPAAFGRQWVLTNVLVCPDVRIWLDDAYRDHEREIVKSMTVSVADEYGVRDRTLMTAEEHDIDGGLARLFCGSDGTSRNEG